MADQPAESRLEPVELRPVDDEWLQEVLEPAAWDRLVRAGSSSARLLEGRRWWHINSAAAGGGVAEMLTWALPLSARFGVDVRWLVLTAPPKLFEITKRLHHLLHESPRPLDEDDRRTYEELLAGAARQASELVRPGDVVVVHDPQPAGLIPALVRGGARIVWRSHIGTDRPGESARRGRGFLEPFLEGASLLVFSRAAFVWDEDHHRTRVIRPAIDPIAPKNQAIGSEQIEAILAVLGLRNPRSGGAAWYRSAERRRAVVHRRADVLQEAPIPAEAPIVTQVSRWDPLKDPTGVIAGFAEHVSPDIGAHLVVAGPAASAVSDDPEGSRVLDEVRRAWAALPSGARGRVHVATLPMEDSEENAAMVNAIQRASTVAVQKSLREGFGLTVAEAMWKGRPVVASAVGGIQEQIEDRVSGLLLADPRDLAAFGRHVEALLGDGGYRDRLGKAAHRKVCDEFLPDRLADDWAGVIRAVLEA